MPGRMEGPAPPFNPLHAFSVAARTLSFTRAGEALGVSQSAVSRQVAVLEGWLGTRLFVRERHGIALTPEGEALRDAAIPAFDALLAATAALRRTAHEAPLRLRVYPTVAAKWLIPRLPRFEALHPGIALRLSSSARPVEFRREAVDMAIQLGGGTWPGLEARRLLPDILQPVCAPALAAKLRAPDDLRRHRLLVSRYRRDDWRDWLAGIGRGDLWREGVEFTSSVLTYGAAEQGLGIAIGQFPLMAGDLREGRLLPVFTAVERAGGHHLVWPADRPPDRKGRAFLAWVQAEAAQDAALA